MNLGIFGFYLLAAAYLLLTALLFTAPLQTSAARLIRILAGLVALWGLANTQLYHGSDWFDLRAVLSLEVARNLLLQLMLLALLRSGLLWRQLRDEPLLWLMAGLSLLVLLPLWGLGLGPSGSRVLVFGGLLGQVLLALFLIEQNFRLLPAKERRAFLPLMIAVGVVLVFDFVIYAEGLLLLQLNPNFWGARGFVWCLAVPGLLLTTRRLPSLGVRVFVSRQVVYHSTLLLVAGGYLLVMAGAGYYIRYFGGDWGRLLQAVFLAAALLLLAAIFFSEPFRRKIKVFIFKHFYANRYDYRVEWLKLNAILHKRQADEGVHAMALRAMTTVANAPCGLLFSRQGDGLVVRASLGEGCQQPLAAAELCALLQFCERERWIVDVAELMAHPGRYRNLRFDGAACLARGIALWVPIYDGGRVIGMFALGRYSEAPAINFEDRDLFNTVSSQLATYLKLEEVNEALSEARQFDAFNRMSAFLLHDIKNIVAQLNLIVINARRHKHNPEFIDDSLDTLSNAVARMQRIMQQLKKSESQPSQSLGWVSLARLAGAAVAAQQQLQPQPLLQLEQDSEVLADGERLQVVIANLIQNAQEATPAERQVRVRLARDGGEAVLEICDEGSGMSPQFVRERLFKPFDTTKGNAGMGIGAYEARQLVLAMGGQFEVDSREGEGTRITLRLPVQAG